MHRITLALVMAFALVTFGLFAPSAPAQSGPPILAIHIDLDAFNQGFSGSRMEQCWNSPTVQQWRSTTLQTVLGEMQNQTGINMNALLTQHRRGQLAIVVSIAEGPYGPEPTGGFAISQPGNIDALMSTLTSGLDANQQTMIQQNMTRQGDVVAFGPDQAFNQNLLAAMSAGPSGLGIQVNPGSCLSGRVDFASIIQMAMAEDPSAAPLMQQLGVANLNALTFGAGFQGQGLASRGELTFNGSTQGIFTLVGPNRVFGFLNMLPANSISASGINIAPPAQIWDFIRTVVSQMDPMAAQNMQQMETQFQQQTGLDLRNQVLGSFGSEYGFVMGGATGMSADMGFFLEVTNQAAVEQMITQLISQANAMMGGMGQPGQTQPAPGIQPMQMTAGDLTYQMVSVPGVPVQVCYAFRDSRLILTTSQNEMTQIANALSSGQSLITSPGFLAVASGMNPRAAMFGYSDNQQAVQQIGGALMPLMMMAGNDMPPEMFQTLSQLPALAPFMGSRGGTMTVEPTRFTFQSTNTSGAEAIAVLMVFGSAMAAEMPQQTTTQSAW